MKEYGLGTNLYEFEALLGWPEEAQVEHRSPASRTLKLITHSFVPSTPREGFEAEAAHPGPGEEADFERQPVEGKIALRWWNTADDTPDKIDPEVDVQNTRVYLLGCARAATVPALPLRHGAAAELLRESLDRYLAGAGDRFDLEPAIERAKRKGGRNPPPNLL